MMGKMVLRGDGYYWYEEDPEEIRFEPYDGARAYREDLSWAGDWNVHFSHYRPRRELTEDEYQAIMSALSGETKEEWIARRLAEGKPISPVGEEKQD